VCQRSARLVFGVITLKDRIERQTPSAEVPEDIREVVRRHVARLPGGGQDILYVAAVAEPDFSIEVVSRICDRPIEEVRELVHLEVDRGVLGESSRGPGSYRFRDPRFRTALYEDLPPARRKWLHREVGEALKALRASSGERGDEGK